MYRRELQHEDQAFRLVITSSGCGNGWEVREERDGQLLFQQRFHDWHRVEFARATFSRPTRRLKDSGWVEVA